MYILLLDVLLDVLLLKFIEICWSLKWDSSIQDNCSILSHHPDCDIPPIVTDLISFLREYSLEVEGLFRRSADVASIKRLQERIDRGCIFLFLLYSPIVVFKFILQFYFVHFVLLFQEKK